MTDTAKMLARAVLADDETAVAGLIDHLLADVDLRQASDWLALWDGYAKAYLNGTVACSHESRQMTVESRASWAYMQADEMMAERARRLDSRNK